MPKKPKFKPVITRIKLNPEQAVLACSCSTVGYRPGPVQNTIRNICDPREIGSNDSWATSSTIS